MIELSTIPSYTVLEHAGGWAFRSSEGWSETFGTRDVALRAAGAAAAREEERADVSRPFRVSA